ncbi:quinone oxidoreductase family protein [Fodinicola acaciae]|uniref:quinone oxidoreductase family protein n=1 Tax=Fodinicola acaciae TaxID=2681555 RepID=UPI0013D36CF1|nr:quinone oxidoreductase [Fodinicola acaciae]
MRAIQVTEPGGADVLKVVDIDQPAIAANQVLVRNAAAGVNYIDTYQRSGVYPIPTPFTLGLEGAGEVVEVGVGVTDIAVGEQVAWKAAPGSYAEYVAVSDSEAVPVPDGVSPELAAAVMLQGLTAHYLAVSTYPVKEGDWAVVHAGAGGVGLLLTEIVKKRGGNVLATTSTPEKAELARSAGADEVTTYDDFADKIKKLTGGKGAHVVYDGVGKTTFDQSLAALRPRGYMVLYGGASGQVPPVDPQRLNSGGSLFLTRPTLVHYASDRDELVSRTDEVFGWIADGSLTVRIGHRYDLADVVQAHNDLEGRKTTGKIILTV